MEPIFRDGKRNRRPTSCEQCRTRKLRCSRGTPCDECVKRGKGESCAYASNAIRNKPKARELQDRLRKVEDMVSELARQNRLSQETTIISRNEIGENLKASYASPSSVKVPGCATTSPRVRNALRPPREEHKVTLQPSPWLSIVDEIKEIREQLAVTPSSIPEETLDREDVDLVLGAAHLPTIAEIVGSLPPRPVCDTLVSYYFGSKYMVFPIIHTTKFQTEYEKFWMNPHAAPVLWIGLLYAVLSVSSGFRQIRTGGSFESPITIGALQTKTIQCLLLGKYIHASEYVLETLILHLESKFIGSVDSSLDLWHLMGIIIRTAMRLGYHRDAKVFGERLSPFDGEMRRRVWHTILQMDGLMSFQMGVPSMIPMEYCNTSIPSNLKDSDFSPESTSLPPARPLTDDTPVLYTIVKAGVMDMFKKVVAGTQSPSSPSYASTIALDASIREIYSTIPDAFRMKPISQSLMDSSAVIMNRCAVEVLFLKSIIVLHRPYLSTETSNPQYDFSRLAAVDAALVILHRQDELHETSQPGGRLYEDRWMISSLTLHDFLLAAMVVCLSLSLGLKSPSESSWASRGHDFEGQLKALEKSKTIWDSTSHVSTEARTAAHILELMIRKVKGKKAGKGAGIQESTTALSINVSESLSQTLVEEPHVDAMLDMFCDERSVDWRSFDQYVHEIGSPGPNIQMPEMDWDLFGLDPSRGENL
ncbi:transcriptional regulator family: Fungal Specific TF [Paecilomyces variotii]|nr:transcriptional regulator family: Fungal Specific TF [Paecilomyces variotii]